MRRQLCNYAHVCLTSVHFNLLEAMLLAEGTSQKTLQLSDRTSECYQKGGKWEVLDPGLYFGLQGPQEWTMAPC